MRDPTVLFRDEPKEGLVQSPTQKAYYVQGMSTRGI